MTAARVALLRQQRKGVELREKYQRELENVRLSYSMAFHARAIPNGLHIPTDLLSMNAPSLRISPNGEGISKFIFIIERLHIPLNSKFLDCKVLFLSFA